MLREEIRKHLSKDYLEFQEIIHFKLDKFREDLKECRSTLDKDLYIYLENEEDPSKIKSALIAFLKTDYKESVDILLSKHYWKISMK